MRMKVEINNKTRSPIKNIDFEKLANFSIDKSGFDFSRKKNITVSLAFISEKEIKEINRCFRKINEPTDILSFSEYSKKDQLNNCEDDDIFLGELLMCYDNIAKYSKKKKLSLKEELKKVFSHGVLHLLGFKHGKKMFSIMQMIADEK